MRNPWSQFPARNNLFRVHLCLESAHSEWSRNYGAHLTCESSTQRLRQEQGQGCIARPCPKPKIAKSISVGRGRREIPVVENFLLFPGDLSLVPSTNVGCFPTTCKSSFQELISSGLQGHLSHVRIPQSRHKYRHPHT